MKFRDFALIKIDFCLNEKFVPSKEKGSINPEIAINHALREEQKELVVSIGLRQKVGNIPYFFEIIGAGLFAFDSIPEGPVLKQLATMNCPAIIFPYVRETIADLTRRSGHKPLHLDPINFVELAKKKAEDKKKKRKS